MATPELKKIQIDGKTAYVFEKKNDKGSVLASYEIIDVSGNGVSMNDKVIVKGDTSLFTQAENMKMLKEAGYTGMPDTQDDATALTDAQRDFQSSGLKFVEADNVKFGSLAAHIKSEQDSLVDTYLYSNGKPNSNGEAGFNYSGGGYEFSPGMSNRSGMSGLNLGLGLLSGLSAGLGSYGIFSSGNLGFWSNFSGGFIGSMLGSLGKLSLGGLGAGANPFGFSAGYNTESGVAKGFMDFVNNYKAEFYAKHGDEINQENQKYLEKLEKQKKEQAEAGKKKTELVSGDSSTLNSEEKAEEEREDLITRAYELEIDDKIKDDMTTEKIKELVTEKETANQGEFDILKGKAVALKIPNEEYEDMTVEDLEELKALVKEKEDENAKATAEKAVNDNNLEAKKLACELKDDMDAPLGQRASFNNNLGKITDKNVVEVLGAYTEETNGTSFFADLFDEFSLHSGVRSYHALEVKSRLIERAEALGINTEDFVSKFDIDLQKQVNSWFSMNADEINRLVNDLCKKIKSKEAERTPEETNKALGVTPKLDDQTPAAETENPKVQAAENVSTEKKSPSAVQSESASEAEKSASKSELEKKLVEKRKELVIIAYSRDNKKIKAVEAEIALIIDELSKLN